MPKQKTYSDLLNDYNTLNDLLNRSQTKFRDLLSAYKSLKKEKQAVEETLKALTEPVVHNQFVEKSAPTVDELSSDTSETQSNTQEAACKGCQDYQNQLETVSKSIQTLLKEKSSSESNFLSERKLLKSDVEKKHSELEVCQKQLHECRSRLTLCNKERESDMTNYKTMLDEVQYLLCNEREKNADLLSQTERLQHDLSAQLSCEDRVQSLSSELRRCQSERDDVLQSLSVREFRVLCLEQEVARLTQSVGRKQHECNQLKHHSAHTTSLCVGACTQTDTEQQPAVCSHSLEELVSLIGAMLCDSEECVQHDISARVLELFSHHGECCPLPSGAVSSVPSSADCADVVAGSLEQQVAELQLQIAALTDDKSRASVEFEKLITSHKESIEELTAAHMHRVCSDTQLRECQVAQLSEELSAQRTRSDRLLAEKNAEIEALSARLKQKCDSATGCGSDIDLSHIKFTRNEAYIIHCAQEAARRDVEIVSLSRRNSQLEMSMKQLQQKIMERECSLQSHIESLNSEVLRLSLNVSREGANLEYVKNVCVSYICTGDVSRRRHMLNAIATALHFSDTDRRNVMRTLRA